MEDVRQYKKGEEVKIVNIGFHSALNGKHCIIRGLASAYNPQKGGTTYIVQTKDKQPISEDYPYSCISITDACLESH